MAVADQPRRWQVAFYRFVRALIHGVAKLFGRIEVIGSEHVPRTGPFVLAPVHRSNIDFALVSLVTKRRMRYMGKDSIWKVKALNPIIDALGAFPVHRGTADREALRTSIAVVESGQPLVMFPEGTRQSGPGTPLRALPSRVLAMAPSIEAACRDTDGSSGPGTSRSGAGSGRSTSSGGSSRTPRRGAPAP